MKVLLLTFEENEEDILTRILSCIGNRTEILEYEDYNIVMSHIRNIREKIEDNPSKPIYIQTVWGVGYRFNKNLVK